MSLGSNIRLLRENKDRMTQKELAILLGVSKATVSLYESDDRIPDANMLYKIADVFGVTMDGLMDRGDLYPKKDYIDKGNVVPCIGLREKDFSLLETVSELNSENRKSVESLAEYLKNKENPSDNLSPFSQK